MNEKAHKIQILKFGLYGFLKNLMFFEPYLLLFFLSKQLSLGQIGWLIAIRSVIVYVFEIPSGVIADRYGKKTELVFCFSFYIISFIIFFFSPSFWYFAIAMVLFGLGEAFRSGTHKAMIMQYLDKNNIVGKKSQIYGKTRSFSLIGSAVMSIMAIVFIIWIPNYKYLFLISIIPFILDMIMILTYPKYMNEKQDAKFKVKEFLKHNYESVKYAITTKNVNRIVINSASFQAGFKSIGDYIQPIIASITAGVILFSAFSYSENLKIYIGLIYFVLYFVSSFASRYAHVLHNKFDSLKLVNSMWFLTGAVLIFLSFFLHSIVLAFFAFLLVYVIQNIRRPVMVDLIGTAVDKSKRASVLSVESQSKSLLLAVFAPAIGYLADYSMQLMLIVFGSLMIGIFILTRFIKSKESLSE